MREGQSRQGRDLAALLAPAPHSVPSTLTSSRARGTQHFALDQEVISSDMSDEGQALEET